MYNHITYMKECAEKLKAIAHTDASPRFHIINGLANMDELLQRITKAAEGFHLLASANIDGAIGYGNDSPTDRQMCQFYVVKRVSITDYKSIADAKADTKAIAAKIIGKMLYDKFMAGTNQANPQTLRNLEPRSFSYQSVGPLADKFFGTEVTFDIFNFVDLVYHAADWE